MIYISENAKKHLSGITSLFLKFPYNPEVVNIIKSSGTYAWDEDSRMWEVPVTSLSYLLDNLYYYDDITLIVKDNVENRQAETLKGNHRTKLFDYQKDGVEYFLNHDKGLLLDAPGLGKTLQMITLAEELKEQRNIEHCLVICGIASLRDNWRKEIKKHSYLDSVIIGERITKTGSRVWEKISKRAEQLKNKINEFFVIINVESLQYDEIIDAIKTSENKFDLMLFDECHKAKGCTSLRSVNLLELSSKYQVGMTGTLLVNKPLDAFIPLAWIGVEEKSKRKGFSGIGKFKDMYCVFDDSIISKNSKSKKYNKGRIVGYKNLDILKDEIDSCSLRRTNDMLDLPEKNIITEYLTLEEDQLKFYNNIKNSVKEEFKQLAKEECDKIKLNTTNLLALTTRLRQASTCPSVLTTNKISSCKIERAIDLVEEITSNGDKVVILSTFKEPVYQLEKLLEEYKPLIGTGDLNDLDVSKNIDTFQSDDEHKVFIGTIQKMGIGVTLTRASYLIFLDESFVGAENLQAQERIHRFGQNKHVFIYILMCRDTIDEKIHEIANTKLDLSSYIIDDVVDESLMIKLQKYLTDLG